jgi:peptidoglycan/xylan/chitin deacetylase (PgdA/CDA1 family)
MARKKQPLSLWKKIKSKPLISAIVLLVVIGSAALAISRADTPFVAAEAEDGTRAGAALVSDASASGGSAVAFGNGAAGVNILKGKAFTANVPDSPSESGPISNMTDDNDATRWISNPSRPVTATVDMGGVYTLSRIQIVWAADTIKNYSLAVSNDATNWTTITTGITNNTPRQTVEHATFSPAAKGRYLRITGTDAWNTTFGNSIWEVRAYGTIDPSFPAGTLANFNGTASGTTANLSWSYSGSGLSGFTLKRNGTTIASPGAAARSYADSGLASGQTYTYTLSGTFTAGGATNTVTKAVAVGATTGGGIISITFDDGQLSQYQNARPILSARGMPATFYFVGDAFGWGGSSMTAAQARQLITEGHEAGNHTKSHPDLTTLAAGAINTQFSGAQSSILSATGKTPTSCAYPYGAYNSTVDTEAKKFFRSCRGTGATDNNPASMNTYNLGTYMMGSAYNAGSVATMAARAKANNSWIILLYHGVGPSGTLDTDTATFTAQMDAIKNSGVRVMTVSDALTALGK